MAVKFAKDLTFVKKLPRLMTLFLRQHKILESIFAFLKTFKQIYIE